MDKQFAIQVYNSCFALNLRRAGRRIGRAYDEALRPAGLNNGQFSLMTILVALDHCPLGEIADRLGVDRTTLNATLKPLERDGLVRSDADPKDGRIRRLSLTPLGLRRLKQAEPLWRATQSAIEGKLEKGSADQLRAGLRLIS
jgi:DNA-binding MarR family transcriptional regulator